MTMVGSPASGSRPADPPSGSVPADPPDDTSGDASLALPPELFVPEPPAFSQPAAPAALVPPSPPVPASPEPAEPLVVVEDDRGFRSSKSAPMICAHAAITGKLATQSQRSRLITTSPQSKRTRHQVVAPSRPRGHWRRAAPSCR